MEAKQVPLTELLEAVPADARLVVDDGPYSTRFIPVGKMCHEAAVALRERLAQPVQEPVAHTLNCVCGAVWDIKDDGSEEMVHTPDATPQQRQWHSLTDEEIADIYIKWDATPGVSMADFARAIEAKLKEKNHG